MPDGSHASALFNEAPLTCDTQPYIPPFALVLAGLGITELDLARAQVTVAGSFMRFLISEFARMMPFDPAYYRAAHPDVEAARLAGDVATLHEHFVDQGYFERRTPHELAFDAFYYATHYDDLSRAFDTRDTDGLRRHYDGHGWQEGRVGVRWQRADADRWTAAVRASTVSEPAR